MEEHVIPKPGTDLTRTLLAILIIGLLIAGSLWVITPFLPALIWAAMIVVSTWPIMISLQHRLGGKRAWAVLTMEVVLSLIVFMPLAAAVITIVGNADVITAWVVALPTYSLPTPPSWLSNIPVVGHKLTIEWQALADGGSGGVAARLQPYANQIINWVLARVGNMGMLFVHLILTLALSGILYAKGEVAALNVIRFAQRLAGTRGEESIILAGQAIRAVALGIVVTALLQSALGGAGVFIAGVPFAGLLTAVMLVLCIAQLGPLLPLLGAVAWLFWRDQSAVGTALLVWTVVVSAFDNFLRPILIKRGANLPLLLIIAGVIGGLLGFGIVGLFVGPVLLAVTYTLLDSWIAEGLDKSKSLAPDPDKRV
jgi:predicted PurR-regulated permease PerM